MIEHPVPQNITEYQFHLIGNMTIKQFLILLVGVVLSFVVYSTNLPSIIKWPIVLFIVIGAIALAFVPYEERTLDQWLVNFIKAIYRPTKYYWQRTAPTPEYFAYTSTAAARQVKSTESAFKPQRQKQVSAYLSSLGNQSHSGQRPADPLDLFKDGKNELDDLFNSVEAAKDVTPGKEVSVEKPNLQVKARPLGGKQQGVIFSTEQTATNAPAAPMKTENAVRTVSTTQFEGMNSSSHQTFTMEATEEPVTESPKAPQQKDSMKPSDNAQTTDVEQISVEKTPLKTETDTKNKQAAPVATEKPGEQHKTYITETKKVGNTSQTVPVIFDKQLPFPSKPDKPNILLGMVHDKSKNIIPGAIVEILDTNGNTVRAMKTNNLGQFYISTPLKKGKYTIETEASEHQFPVYSLEVNDSVLDPVDIQASS